MKFDITEKDSEEILKCDEDTDFDIDRFLEIILNKVFANETETEVNVYLFFLVFIYFYFYIFFFI